MRKTAFIWLLLLSLAFSLPAKAGWVITEQSNDSFGNKSYSTIFIQDSIIRTDKPTSISMINFNQNLITLIFPQHRSYWQGTSEKLRKTTIRMAEEQMTKLLAYAPEQKKQEIKQVLDSLKKRQTEPDSLRFFSHITIKKLGSSDTLLGYPATEYDIIIDSIIKKHVWVTRNVKPYHDVKIDRILAFSKAVSPFAIENSLNSNKDYMKLLKEGIILKSVSNTPTGNKIITKVTKIRKMDIPEAIFQIPHGYVPTSLENVMILDMKNNILDPKNIAPDGDGTNDDMPPLPHNNKINSKDF